LTSLFINILNKELALNSELSENEIKNYTEEGKVFILELDVDFWFEYGKRYGS